MAEHDEQDQLTPDDAARAAVAEELAKARERRKREGYDHSHVCITRRLRGYTECVCYPEASR